MQEEGTEDFVTEGGQAEVPGGNEVEEQSTEGPRIADQTENLQTEKSVLWEENKDKGISSILTHEELGRPIGMMPHWLI